MNLIFTGICSCLNIENTNLPIISVWKNIIGDSLESPKQFTTATHKCVSLFWRIFFGTFLDKVQKGHHA